MTAHAYTHTVAYSRVEQLHYMWDKSLLHPSVVSSVVFVRVTATTVDFILRFGALGNWLPANWCKVVAVTTRIANHASVVQAMHVRSTMVHFSFSFSKKP